MTAPPQPPPAAKAKKPPAHMKCRNPHCDSITVEELPLPKESGQRVYRCTKCGHPIALNVGGGFMHF